MFACREGSGLRGVDNHLAPLIPFAWSGVGWNSYSSRKTERASECESQMGEWPMALDGLRLGLMALGYQQVIWTTAGDDRKPGASAEKTSIASSSMS
jgi:hypothetical protein